MQETWDIALNVALAVVGLLGGVAVSHFYYRRGGAARHRLEIGMVELARIDPAAVGVRAEIKIGAQVVTNLVVLEISVRNAGQLDLDLHDGANDEALRNRRPRIELPVGLRALAGPWNPDGAPHGADVRVARQLLDGRQLFHLHVRTLAARTEVVTRVVCAYPEAEVGPPLEVDQLAFYPGFIAQLDVSPAGLLARARKPRE